LSPTWYQNFNPGQCNPKLKQRAMSIGPAPEDAARIEKNVPVNVESQHIVFALYNNVNVL
jgi:hypothetical protein